VCGDSQGLEFGLEGVAHLRPKPIQDVLFDLHEGRRGGCQHRPWWERGGQWTRDRWRGWLRRDADLSDQPVQPREASHRRRRGRPMAGGDAGRGAGPVGAGSVGHSRRCSNWRLMAEIASIACQER
jgi:hypothetical protein